MSDHIDTREGWREVRLTREIADLAPGDEYLQLIGIPQGNVVRVWVREAPVPPLPTEENTVIEVTWRHGVTDRLWLSGGKWRTIDGILPYSLDQIKDFKVLAGPISEADAEWLAEQKAYVRRETAKAVLDLVRKEAERFIPKGNIIRAANAVARKFEEES